MDGWPKSKISQTLYNVNFSKITKTSKLLITVLTVLQCKNLMLCSILIACKQRYLLAFTCALLTFLCKLKEHIIKC